MIRHLVPIAIGILLLYAPHSEGRGHKQNRRSTTLSYPSTETKAALYISKQRAEGPLLPLATRVELGFLADALNLKKGLEIGVRAGDFSAAMLNRWKSMEDYYCVDAWEHQKNYFDRANVDNKKQIETMEVAKERLKEWGKRVHIVKGYSTDVAPRFEDGSLDFIYIDARHDYLGVLEDLTNYWPKLRKGGIMAGHDLIDCWETPLSEHWSISANGTDNGQKAVRQAVVEFLGAKNREFQVTYGDGNYPSFYAMK